MKWLLAIVAYFTILWGWRKMAGMMSKPGNETRDVKGSAKKKPDKTIDPNDIEDAHFTEIKEERSKENHS